jgi:hypothetical protein
MVIDPHSQAHITHPSVAHLMCSILDATWDVEGGQPLYQVIMYTEVL